MHAATPGTPSWPKLDASQASVATAIYDRSVFRGNGITPEPRNPHDANAIAVSSSRGVQMGYIVADRTSIIHKAWAAARDVRAVFQEPIVGGSAIRVAFDRDPMLPPPRPADHIPEARKTVGGSPDAWDGVDYIPPNE